MTELSTLPANASKIEIKNAIGEYNSELKRFKEQLTNMVPYRALAGFFARSKEKAEWNSIRRMTTYIKEINDNITPLPYVLGESSKLKKEVRFHQDWIKMIQDNTVNILGWIQYEKVKWLEVREIRDVFTGREIVPKQYDVDHFIPWSFVMNDELWNLMPMESSLNSSKSNRLPKWNPFFKDFAYNQYILYGMIHENANIHKRFEVCYGDNLHSIWAGQELYRKGNTEEEFYNILEKNMLPVYESARRQGYEIWEY